MNERINISNENDSSEIISGVDTKENLKRLKQKLHELSS